MNRRAILQLLSLSPLAILFPSLRAEAAPNFWLQGSIMYFPTLHLYESECDYVLAASPEDAVQVFRTTFGPFPDGLLDMPGHEPEDWRVWPEDKPFEMTEESDDSKGHSGTAFFTTSSKRGWTGLVSCTHTYTRGHYTARHVALPRWWAEQRGRGPLAGRE